MNITSKPPAVNLVNVKLLLTNAKCNDMKKYELTELFNRWLSRREEFKIRSANPEFLSDFALDCSSLLIY